MAALEDHAADGVVIPQQEVVEDGAVVLVVDFELGCDVEATGEHVRARSLQSNQVDRCRKPRGAWVRPAPLPFRRGDAGARHWIELVLLDQTREAFGPSPAEMAAYPAGEPRGRALARGSPVEDGLVAIGASHGGAKRVPIAKQQRRGERAHETA